MSFLKKLFGGSGGGGAAKTKKTEPVDYEGFRIYAEPVNESGGYRVAARIEKDFGDETKTHQMIRADVANSLEEATSTSVTKAKSFIDQMGDRLFG